MGELANYSIETDQLIWLAFKDGRNLRVPVASLSKYLSPRDLQKVRRAMNLRQDFLRHNMPKTLVAVLAFGLLALMVAGTQVIARLDHGAGSASPALPGSQIVRSAPSSSSEPSPVPSPASNTATSLTHQPATPAKVKTAVVTHTVVSRPAATPATTVTGPIADNTATQPPAATPAPSPTPAPTPDPSPAPTPPAGQVLGDSTGPDPSPTPTPAPTN